MREWTPEERAQYRQEWYALSNASLNKNRLLTRLKCDGRRGSP